MPGTLNPPAVASQTINDLINQVKADLQNRSDVVEGQANPEMNPSAWIRDALKEITANYPFEELRINNPPLVTIGPGLGYKGSSYMYPVSQFLNPGDDVTLTEDPVIFFTPSQATSVGLIVGTTSNIIGYPMNYLNPKAIQTLLFVPGGIPYNYSRYGNQFWFGPQPGQPYQVYLPYQVRHPFLTNLVNSPVRVPPDWIDVICFAAAERGAIRLRWNDQATFIHNILYGDPDYQKSGGQEGRPGLIAARMFQQDRDQRLSPIQLTVATGS
jgi:hypothetical protein